MKSIVHRAAAEAGAPAIDRPGVVLVHRSVCERIVDACERESARILGIDAFELGVDRCTPRLDLIADFSDLDALERTEACGKSVVAARAYLRNINPTADLWFEFVVSERVE